jgi:hypothetical protein
MIWQQKWPEANFVVIKVIVIRNPFFHQIEYLPPNDGQQWKNWLEFNAHVHAMFQDTQAQLNNTPPAVAHIAIV